jgi:hypothetical protein
MSSYVLFCSGLRITLCLDGIETFFKRRKQRTGMKKENGMKIKKETGSNAGGKDVNGK